MAAIRARSVGNLEMKLSARMASRRIYLSAKAAEYIWFPNSETETVIGKRYATSLD
jgi:hypothetical protein